MEQKKSEKKKNKPYGKALILGALSLASYIVVFKNEQAVMELFTMGGWRTVFPIVTALVFSFLHGAFASDLLICLGLEAKKK